MTISSDPIRHSCRRPPQSCAGFPSFVLTASVLMAPAAPAVTINLTDVTVSGAAVSQYLGNDAQFHVGGSINGVFFLRSVPGSGSGQFRTLFRMEDSGDPDVIENGYNRGGIMDSSTPGGFDPLIRVQDLRETTEGGFYMFALDANESNGQTNSYLSLDMVKIYVGGATDPASLPTTEADLAQLGTRVYSFGTDDRVLNDANTSSGSGTADMFMFVPTSLFSGFAPDSYVYLFAQHGGFAFPGFGASSGFEEWAIIQTAQPSFLPEPGAALLGIFSGAMLLGSRRRSLPPR